MMLIASEALLQGLSPQAATSRLMHTEGQGISTASARLVATEEGQGSISTASQGLITSEPEATNEIPGPYRPLSPCEAVMPYDAHAYPLHSENQPHCALQFQDNMYLPDGYAPMGFNNVGWYNLGPHSAENHHRLYVPMYAPLAPPPPYCNLYHLDMQ